ncbi:aspartyl protease family protein [Labilibaculum sp. K2S]|uniref:aspartyl protease family protein n=1 Tax=Labilibaculum sp. K2S TaxID=3056386 RepID=UPI0025A3EC1A|nr:aspartyl protease family protein [Labilibaculum sp. K2S]MDM8159583.1 aspartyl protease family protein [Labilibaculum sp. K2S]
MKYLKNLIIIGILFTLTSCANKKTDKIIDNELNQLLEQKDYFKLRERLESNEDKLTEDRLLYYKAFVTNAFGEKKQSNEHINVLLEKYKNEFNDSTLTSLLDLKASNYLYSHDYKQASASYAKMLNDYPNVLDSVEIANCKNVKNLFVTFSNVKPQIMHKNSLVQIASYRNKFNHIMTPVKSNGVCEDFIFDTGANLSTIAESQAKKMNLTLFEQNVDVGSSTKINVQSKLAVADSLYVGDILFENVVFLVLADDQLTFPEVNYQIHGIVGFPVIHQLEEVHLHKNGNITVPKSPKEKKLKNMVLEGLTPVVKVISDNDTLLFTLDTGAKNSELSFKYFNEHKSEIENRGELQTNARGGAGGRTTVKEYLLKNFPMKIGTKKTTLTEIPVTLEEYDFNKYFDGNLGQDIFNQFNTLIINFKYMYVDFE